MCDIFFTVKYGITCSHEAPLRPMLTDIFMDELEDNLRSVISKLPCYNRYFLSLPNTMNILEVIFQLNEAHSSIEFTSEI